MNKMIQAVAFTLLLFSGSPLPALAQSGTKSGSCPAGAAFPITSLTADHYNDLAFLKEIVKNKRVVLLGESSHGIGDYYSLKSRLVKYLHQECGFEILALESGIADIFLEYGKIDTISARTLRNNTVYGNFQCNEIMPLFDYIKQTASTSKPLRYCGFDSQNFGSSLWLLRTICKDLKGAAGDSLIRNIEKYYRIPSLLWQQDRNPLISLADTIRSSANAVQQLLETNKTAILAKYKLSQSGFEFLMRAVTNHIEGVSVNWYTEDPSAKRDSTMAGNLFWLMDKIYPGKKVIVWAHNGHIGKKSPENNPYTWLGEFINKRFAGSSYHIGLFAQKGETYEWWTKTNKAFNNNKSDDIEKLSGIYANTFVHFNRNKTCNWANKKLFGYELENGGRIRFVPAERFDAIITLQQVKLPVYQ